MFNKIKEYDKRIKELEEAVADLKKKVSIKDPNETSNPLFGMSWTFFGNYGVKKPTIGETVSLLLSHLGLEVKHNDEQFALQNISGLTKRAADVKPRRAVKAKSRKASRG